MEVNTASILNIDFILTFGKGAILLILILYAIFALVIVRQVDLMSKTLITSISRYIRLFATVHAIFALVFILLAWGIL